MFKEDVFLKWLDSEAERIVEKLGAGEPLKTEEMIVLILKAQANHFQHLDEDLRNEIKQLREDMEKRFDFIEKRFNFMQWFMGIGFTFIALLITLINFFGK